MDEMSGLGMDDFSMFTSPWAQTFDDEQFFTDTATLVGNVNSLKISVLHLYMFISASWF